MRTVQSVRVPASPAPHLGRSAGRPGPAFVRAFLAILILAGAATARADGDGSFTGSFRIGFRTVDVGGTETKFLEDYNIGDGARLFGFDFDYVPESDETRRLADRVQLDLTNLGGDAFETVRFSIQKYGRYDLKYHRTKSNYFYEDVILPVELGDPSLSNAGDFHTFDFDRVRDVASFDLRINARAQLHLGFERFTKDGDSTTTLDIQRDEFELDKPVDELYDDFRIGFEYAWPKVTLIVEERVRDYENHVEIFLPGRSLGEDPADATTLDFFFLDQPYEYDSEQHSLRINARPNRRVIVRGSALFQDLDLDVHADETSQGTTFTGAPTSTDVRGAGDIARDTEIFDLDVSYLINDRVALVGGVRRQSLDQEGAFDFGPDRNRGVWDIETRGVELGVEANLSSELTVAGGVRYESRDVDSGHTTDGSAVTLESESTDQDGFFASLSWRPSKVFLLDVEVEDSSYDDPFTLTSPSSRERYRLRARVERRSGFYAHGTFAAHRYENDVSGWEAERDQLSLRLGYRRQGLDVAAGYSLIEADRDIAQLVTTNPGFGGGVTFLFPILYRSDADFLDLRLRYKAGERVTFGGDLRFYDASGSFGVEREDLDGWVECRFGIGYLVRFAYRTIDYDETLVDFDDYDADIAEFSVGYRW